MSLSTSKKGGNVVPSVLVALLLGLLIVPAIYWMHRLQYRTFTKMVAKQASKGR
jgi:hypothetical protein